MERGLGMLKRIQFIGNNYQIIHDPSEVPEEITKAVSYTHLITEVRPNVSTQPEFGTALAEAKAAGVRVLFLLCRVGRDICDTH